MSCTCVCCQSEDFIYKVNITVTVENHPTGLLTMLMEDFEEEKKNYILMYFDIFSFV